MKLRWTILQLLFLATPLLAQMKASEMETTLNGLEYDCHCSKSHSQHHHHTDRQKKQFAYFYTNTEPVILFGEKIPLNHRTIHTSGITRDLTRDEIIFHKTGSYLITYTVTAKRVAVESGTRIPLFTLPGGFLVGLFHYDMLTGKTIELPGTRYGVLTQTALGIDTQQLFAQVIVKIRSAGSRISLRNLTPDMEANFFAAMQLQTRVSNPDFTVEPNVSASVTVQKL
ncbi:MAG: hypothetical protein K2X53_05495 [Alphaproteobacteria bacterium]|nr:hypothetical protein [Alphaproteobacteria bacterium]